MLQAPLHGDVPCQLVYVASGCIYETFGLIFHPAGDTISEFELRILDWEQTAESKEKSKEQEAGNEEQRVL